ncbi:LacI family transcriptional regulator [Alteribacter lacisalsi]|uniref:LacI family transcriptional regulator n=2 Tax=Alteribacter lacisalsi TaxID=2045244 RepID=A0A2W0HJ35_9BACI|nr:LacI family transcriptional regulator [Alteribacter lacisalsi]
MATISDVAKRSGLSKTTVSRVINNYPHVTPEKREKVLKAMEELAYTPSPAARRMRGQLKSSIGIIVTRITNPFFTYLVDAIEQLAYKKGYQVMVFQSNDDREKELKYLSLLKTKQVDGIILAATVNEWETIEPFTEYGPIVFCNEFIKGTGLPTVRLDEVGASYEGMMHLIGRGHTKIAYCTGGVLEGNERNIGFQRALKEAGIDLNLQWIFLNKYNIDGGKQVVRAMLRMDDRPTAVFAGGDEVAAGIILEAKEAGLRIPEDLAVIGFDDQPLAELLDPKLTTIRQPVKQMGEEALENMITALNSGSVKNADRILSAELVVRQTT